MTNTLQTIRANLEQLACLGNGDRHGNSTGNVLAIEALDLLDKLVSQEPVAWGVTCEAMHTNNVFGNKAAAVDTFNRLCASHPQYPREVVPLYAATPPSPASEPKGDDFDAEFLSKRLARVARIVGVPMPASMTHRQICAVAGTILGDIARKLEATQPPAPAPVQPVTYSSTQATTCARCGEYKHTPLRIDAMGGYVCLTCIDQKLGTLLGEFGYPEPPPQPVNQHLLEDAKRGRFMIKNGCWHRRDAQAHLAVLVTQGSDLSCYAMREKAIDAAIAAAEGVSTK